MIEKTPDIVKNILFPQLIDNFILICSDPFGNYLVQKMLTILDHDCLDSIIKKVAENFEFLSIHNFGTRVVQKLIEIGKPDRLSYLNDQIKIYMPSLGKNQNGIHVISKFVSNSPDATFIYNYMIDNVVPISVDKEGCCMIQKILEIQKNKDRVS